jgi:uncharacterized protein with ATP-grasp and redox domains
MKAIYILSIPDEGNIDPYRDDKELATELALALYPELKEKVRVADDPLEMAVRIAIAGNIIDLGVADSYDLEATLQRVLTQAFAINDLDALRSALKQSDSILACNRKKIGAELLLRLS